MAIEAISNEPLNVKSCPIFFHFLINAFLLILVADISAPGLLDGDSRTSPLDHMVYINNEWFFVVFQERHQRICFLLYFEGNGFAVVVVHHSGEMFHHEFVFALEVTQTGLVLIEGEFFKPAENIFAFGELLLGDYLIAVADV
jgi:hypothetical protein